VRKEVFKESEDDVKTKEGTHLPILPPFLHDFSDSFNRQEVHYNLARPSRLAPIPNVDSVHRVVRDLLPTLVSKELLGPGVIVLCRVLREIRDPLRLEEIESELKLVEE